MRLLKPFALILLAGLAMATVVYGIIRWIPFGEYPGDPFSI